MKGCYMSTTSCRRRIPTAMQHTSTVHPQAEYRGGGGRAKRFTYTCGSGQYSGQSVTVRACDGRAADLWFRTVQRSVRDRAGRRWTRLAITPRAAETRTCWPACKTHSSPPNSLRSMGWDCGPQSVGPNLCLVCVSPSPTALCRRLMKRHPRGASRHPAQCWAAE